MTESKVNTFFVSEKISKIRWLPEQLHESDRFITGCWDMRTNHVRIWRLQQNQYLNEHNEYAPRCNDKVAIAGDVTGLEFLNENSVVASSSDGHINLMRIQRAVDVDQIEQIVQSQRLHNFNKGDRAAPCTAVAVYSDDIATVGEDGRLNIINATNLNQLRRSLIADSCALLDTAFISQQEVLTASRMGVIRMFDIRASSEAAPVVSFMTACEDEKRCHFVSCLTSHPTQKHIVLAGSEEGSITVWDLRQPGYPTSYLSAHSNAITDIAFHRTEPTKLFSSAECGELWLWAQRSQAGENIADHENGSNPWLNGERTKSQINVTALISKLRKSVNSFDAQGSRVVCGSDSEAVYLIDNII